MVGFHGAGCALDHTLRCNVPDAGAKPSFARVSSVSWITQLGKMLREGAASPQWTLTVSSSWLQALAIAASRLSVSMIGVPSAACRA